MLHFYPEISQVNIDRQNQAWWFCDEASCNAEVEVIAGKVPEGWRTTHPEDNVYQGAANFCPEHAQIAYKPLLDPDPNTNIE